MDGAVQTGDMRAGSPIRRHRFPRENVADCLPGFRAVASSDASAKSQAIKLLLGLPQGKQDGAVARLLARLGATPQAFDIAARTGRRLNSHPLLFWNPDMRPVLDDPRFPALATKLGLMGYWRKSKARPDVCGAPSPTALLPRRSEACAGPQKASGPAGRPLCRAASSPRTS